MRKKCEKEEKCQKEDEKIKILLTLYYLDGLM